MALSIKNERAARLAAELAYEAGETITEALVHALEERLTRIKSRSVAVNELEAIRELGRHCAGLPDQDTRSAREILGYANGGAP